jgi:hypothetical protein
MTPERARELIRQQMSFSSGYNRNAIRLILGEIQREHGQSVTDKLILEFNLEQAFDIKPGTDFSGIGR